MCSLAFVRFRCNKSEINSACAGAHPRGVQEGNGYVHEGTFLPPRIDVEESAWVGVEESAWVLGVLCTTCTLLGKISVA